MALRHGDGRPVSPPNGDGLDILDYTVSPLLYHYQCSPGPYPCLSPLTSFLFFLLSLFSYLRRFQAGLRHKQAVVICSSPQVRILDQTLHTAAVVDCQSVYLVLKSSAFLSLTEMSSPYRKVATDIALTNMGYKTAVSTVLSRSSAASHLHYQFDTLLADIPALSVGLLGFAVLTFFMILKKVKLSVFPRNPRGYVTLTFFVSFRANFLLQISVLFTFFAAIVDLTRVSLRHANSTIVQQEEDNVTNALRTVREALCSIASGLRFLYFWAFVSQAPLCEQGLNSFLPMHSGRWLHWGLTGTVLRWSTLVASVAIFVLQALWRLVHSLRRFGPVYEVESAFEITASGIFIIKLILNASIVEESCRRQTLWQYSTAFFALVINSGIGIGNLLHCKLFPQNIQLLSHC